MVAAWVARFAAYRHPPTAPDVRAWLEQFKDDQNTAGNILDNTELMSEAEVHESFRRSLLRIPGWHPTASERSGRWFFVGYGPPGKSGQTMLGLFREANRMKSKRYQKLFVSPLELPHLHLTAADTVVFVDDFAGTGKQAAEFWEITKELIASEAKNYMILAAATRAAIDFIKGKTDLKIYVHRILENDKNIFHKDCAKFTRRQLGILINYCNIADRKNPKGFGDCGLLFAFGHTVPNNSLPIIHVSKKNRWKAILPRYL